VSHCFELFCELNLLVGKYKFLRGIQVSHSRLLFFRLASIHIYLPKTSTN
jgi:hypothetical protein